MNQFSCENVTKSYAGKNVIEDINLSLPEGHIISLLGPSGVGKTTLFNVLSGVDLPDSGRVLLNGQDITGKAGHIGYMLQKDLLLPYKTIVDNVSLPLLLQGIPKKEARKQAKQYFARFGLENCELLYPSQLSGGMRQRASLLRTHLTGNHVLLLDEPFSALDAITKSQMHAWYLDIMQELQASTLFITHDIDEALVLSDTVYILTGSPGKISKTITPPPRPRAKDYITSESFMQCKRAILQAIST